MNNNQVKLKLIILISALIMIPSLLVINQRDIEVSFDEKNTNEVINPQLPRQSSVNYEDTTGSALDVYVSGDYAYVADRESGLAVINISDPTNPGTPVYEDTTGTAIGVYVSGDYAYVADWGSGLAVINISDPTNPGTPVYEDTTGAALDVYVSGDYAYVADGAGLAVINISDPTNPGTPVYEDTTGDALGVYVSGVYAYVAAGTGLAVIDISDPTNPGAPVYEDTTGGAVAVYVSGDYAYVADGDSGLAVIYISDPTNPGTPVYQDTTGDARNVYVSGNYAYVADIFSGLAIISISNPTNPGTPVYQDTTGGAHGVYVSGDYAYVADRESGLAIIGIYDPIITNAPSDFTVEYGYTGVSISWTAYDMNPNPNNYTIGLQGVGVVAGPSAWLSGTAITYNVPDGLAVGEYLYTVNFTDDYDYYATDTVKMTVIEDIADPIISNAPSNFTVDYGYTGVNISWTATDTNPDIYTIGLQGGGVVAGPSGWSSGTVITYNVLDGLAVGEYLYTVNFTDDYGYYATDTVKMTVKEVTTDGGAISFGNYYLIFLVIGIISLVIFQKRRKQSSYH